MAGQEVICSAFGASSAICDETRDSRAAGAHQGPARLQVGERARTCPTPQRGLLGMQLRTDGERRKAWRRSKASESGQWWEAVFCDTSYCSVANCTMT